MRLPRSACFSIMTVVLVACGSAPLQSSVPPSSNQPTVVQSVTVAPQPTVAIEPTVKPTAEPTAVPKAAQPLAEAVQQQYTALLLLQGSAAMLDETAAQIQAGKLQGFDGFGRLIVIGGLLKAVDEKLTQTTPVAALEPAWAEAKVATTQLRGMVGDWLDKKISSKEVPELVGPIQQNLEQVISKAENNLAMEYGSDSAELSRIRKQAVDQLRAIAEPSATTEAEATTEATATP